VGAVPSACVISATVSSLHVETGFFGFGAFEATAPADTVEPASTAIKTANTNATRRIPPIAPPSLHMSETSI
jgi:hypothetical protein